MFFPEVCYVNFVELPKSKFIALITENQLCRSFREFIIKSLQITLKNVLVVYYFAII